MKQKHQLFIGKFFLISNIILVILILLISYLYHPLLCLGLFPLAVWIIFYTIWRYKGLHQDLFTAIQGISNTLIEKNKQGITHIPYPALFVSQNRIIWHNTAFLELYPKQICIGMKWSKIHANNLEMLLNQPGAILHHHHQYFKIYTLLVSANQYFVMLIPITELYQAQQEYLASRPAVIIFLVDSYEEIVRDSKESEKTYILSEINRTLEQYVSTTSGFLIHLDHQRYLAILEKRHFDIMVQQHFSVLMDIKNIHTNKKIPITLSIGASNASNSLEENRRNAFLALDMALGRGGDQAAIKKTDGFQFFGGGSTSIGSRTKVKARIVASAIQDLVEHCDNVLIMGHQYPDLDAVGSAIGIACACQSLGKEVRILLDRKKCLAQLLVEYIDQQSPSSIFISQQNAHQWIRRNTLLFITDTHSNLFLESLSLYQACKQVIVIDHHRKTVNYIDNALIFYHEPSASSASELVTELVQYFTVPINLEPCHANALLAGIMLDTKNFIMNAGVRTFEAASFLKQCGADTMRVRKLFSGSMADYRSRSALVSTAEIYKGCAIASTDQQDGDIRVLAAQAADDLLGIHGVEASFVIFKEDNTVSISARSLGKINVQLIMEQLGGGGHLTMAATQLENLDCEQVKTKLIPILEEYCIEHPILH